MLRRLSFNSAKDPKDDRCKCDWLPTVGVEEGRAEERKIEIDTMIGLLPSAKSPAENAREAKESAAVAN